jgi:predicted transcriptional regulator
MLFRKIVTWENDKPVKQEVEFTELAIEQGYDQLIKQSTFKVVEQILLHLDRHKFDCYRSQDNIAKECGVTQQQISREIRKLVSHGFISNVRKQKYGNSTHYHNIYIINRDWVEIADIDENDNDMKELADFVAQQKDNQKKQAERQYENTFDKYINDL